MGWRYNIIVLGLMTLVIFFLRYFVFTFHESPKFLLSRGREQEAIDVLHKVAKFNKQPAPTLTVQHFREIEQAESMATDFTQISDVNDGSAPNTTEHVKHVATSALSSLKHLKGLFGNRLQVFIFVLLIVTYMGDYW
jgi:hypothetical protein